MKGQRTSNTGQSVLRRWHYERLSEQLEDLAAERSSAWLTVLPLQDLGFNLNKREFRDAVKLRYDWPVEDIPSTYACGEAFTVDHSMI